MTVQAWLLFCVTETALCLTPGPSSLLVASVALTGGRAAGVLGANAPYFALSAAGLVAARSVLASPGGKSTLGHRAKLTLI